MAGIPRISMHYQCDFCDRRFGQPECTVPVSDIGACSPPISAKEATTARRNLFCSRNFPASSSAFHS